MAKAINARTEGDDYQARWFWRQACRLFDSNTKVVEVAFEAEGVKAIDDVVVYYGPGMVDEYLHPLLADFYSVKYHRNVAGAITGDDLTNPKFINATSFSFLQRLRDAQREHAPKGRGCRFFLYSPWGIDPRDPLAKLMSGHGGWSLDLDKLISAAPGSDIGKMRGQWQTHLGLSSADDLVDVLRPLCIVAGFGLQVMGEALNLALAAAGMSPVEDGTLSHPYDDLTRKLLRIEKTRFNRQQIQKFCKSQGLWRGTPVREDARQIGIRTFLRRTEYLEDHTDDLLCLTKFFDGRAVRSKDLWEAEIFPAMSGFLSRAVQEGRRHHLHLHVHSSLAFAAGYCLDTKSGVDVVPVQSTSLGRVPWRPNKQAESGQYPGWEVTWDDTGTAGTEVAIAISSAHPVVEDVRRYVSSELPGVGRIVSFKARPYPGNEAILDAAHAKFLAGDVARWLKTNRSPEERASLLHLFGAAPNGLFFFLGQLAGSFGSCRLYEYDFDTSLPGAYSPSLAFPLARA